MTMYWMPDDLRAGLTDEQISQMAEDERARLLTYRAKIADRMAPYKTVSFEEALDLWIEMVSNPVANTMQTGWPKVDEALGTPIVPGEVVVVGARTGVGKTLIATHMMLEKLRNDLSAQAVILNMEMSDIEMVERMAANIMGTTPDDVKAQASGGALSVDDVTNRAPWAKRCEFFNKPGAKAEHLSLVLESVAAKTGNDPDLLIVDYMQLLGGDDNIYQRTSNNAKMLKTVAMQHKVTILTCVQLSRGGKSGEVKPSLSDLRDSGVIEEAADRVLLFWRDTDLSERIYGQLSKNRHGRSGGTFTLAMDAALRIRQLLDTDVYGVD